MDQVADSFEVVICVFVLPIIVINKEGDNERWSLWNSTNAVYQDIALFNSVFQGFVKELDAILDGEIVLVFLYELLDDG